MQIGPKNSKSIERKQIMHRKHLFRALVLSMLAAIGIMAVSASAAQAKWLILVNKTSVLKAKFDVQALLGELLVPNLGLDIHCNGGTGFVDAVLSSDHKTLNGSGQITFTGCTVLGAKGCAVEGGGANPGEIVATGSGTATMSGAKDVTVPLSSPEFAFVEIVGALCPFNEVGGEIAGDAHVILPDPTSKAVTHLGTADDLKLTFGGEPATIHAGHNGISRASSESTDVPIHVTEQNDSLWAITLVGL